MKCNGHYYVNARSGLVPVDQGNDQPSTNHAMEASTVHGITVENYRTAVVGCANWPIELN